MEALAPATLAGSRLEHDFHACALVRAEDEEENVLVPFIREGLEAGEKIVYITEPARRDALVSRLEEAGIDVDERRRRGQLQVLDWYDAYLRDGRFDVESMLRLVEAAIDRSEAEGYPRTRIVGHMEWALEQRPGVEDLIDYEMRVNSVLSERRQPAVCVYDIGRFNGSTLVDIMATHPVVVLGDRAQINPFFVPPATFPATPRRAG